MMNEQNWKMLCLAAEAERDAALSMRDAAERRCARLERERDERFTRARVAEVVNEARAEERRKFVDATAPYFSSRRRADAVADLAEARDRCASLEAALREARDELEDAGAPGSAVDRIDALLGPSPEPEQHAFKQNAMGVCEYCHRPVWDRIHPESAPYHGKGEPPEGTTSPEGSPCAERLEHWREWAMFHVGSDPDNDNQLRAAVNRLMEKPADGWPGEPPEGTETERETLGNEGAGESDSKAAGAPVPSAPSPLHGETEQLPERLEVWWDGRWWECRRNPSGVYDTVEGCGAFEPEWLIRGDAAECPLAGRYHWRPAGSEHDHPAETENEATERRRRWAEERAESLWGQAFGYELGAGVLVDAMEAEARHLSTRTTPRETEDARERATAKAATWWEQHAGVFEAVPGEIDDRGRTAIDLRRAYAWGFRDAGSPRIAGQPEHQKGQAWAADPFDQLERLADWCNARDVVDTERPIVDVVMETCDAFAQMATRTTPRETEAEARGRRERWAVRHLTPAYENPDAYTLSEVVEAMEYSEALALSTRTTLDPIRDHALGLVQHANLGACPEPGNPDARDPGCPVCQALTRTTPDPESKATPPQGAQMESETSIAPPVSLPEGLRILADGVIEWRDQGGDFIQTSIEDGEFYVSTSESPRADAAGFGILARIDQVAFTLHRAGLVPGATLTEDQRRDLRAMAALREQRVEGVYFQTVDDDTRGVWWCDIPRETQADDPADAILSTLGGDR